MLLDIFLNSTIVYVYWYTYCLPCGGLPKLCLPIHEIFTSHYKIRKMPAAHINKIFSYHKKSCVTLR